VNYGARKTGGWDEIVKVLWYVGGKRWLFPGMLITPGVTEKEGR